MNKTSLAVHSDTVILADRCTSTCILSYRTHNIYIYILIQVKVTNCRNERGREWIETQINYRFSQVLCVFCWSSIEQAADVRTWTDKCCTTLTEYCHDIKKFFMNILKFKSKSVFLYKRCWFSQYLAAFLCIIIENKVSACFIKSLTNLNIFPVTLFGKLVPAFR